MKEIISQHIPNLCLCIFPVKTIGTNKKYILFLHTCLIKLI
mgnify:CR=1 FL=1